MGSTVSKGLRWKIMLRDGFKCRYCGAMAAGGARLVLDHAISRSESGSTTHTNLITACDDCNTGKGGRSLSPSCVPVPQDVVAQMRLGTDNLLTLLIELERAIDARAAATKEVNRIKRVIFGARATAATPEETDAVMSAISQLGVLGAIATIEEMRREGHNGAELKAANFEAAMGSI